MSKPREWWFNVTWHGEYSVPIDQDPMNVGDDDEIVRVIEKSAYDELEIKVRELTNQSHVTNSNWPHEKKLCLEIDELKIKLSSYRETLESIIKMLNPNWMIRRTQEALELEKVKDD